MNRKLPTYDEAVMLSSYPGSPFYETKLVIDGFNISMFNYRIAQFKDFNDSPGAFEMRGLTFVFNNDGTLYKRYLLLHKFFNLNQTPDSSYEVVKNYTIKTVQYKEDGSIVSFIKLPNGRVIGKTKMGFDNSQTESLNRIYQTNKEIKKFVDWSLDNDLVAIFELVGPLNKIVLRYPKEELVLLKLRSNKTGKYYDLIDFTMQTKDIKVVQYKQTSHIDELVDLAQKLNNIEGWVVEFSNGHFLKIKTAWYVSLHGLLTEDVHRENVIIESILDDKVDDLLGQISQDDLETHTRINKIISIVKKYVNDKVSEINNSYDLFVTSGMSKKDYAINHRVGNQNFNFVMNLVKLNEFRTKGDMESYNNLLPKLDTYRMVVEFLKDNTKKLSQARQWLKEKEPNLYFQDLETDN